MDDLVRTVSEKSGIPQETAAKAVNAVMDYLKQKLPDGMGDQLTSFLASNSGQASGVVGDLIGKAKGLVGAK